MRVEKNTRTYISKKKNMKKDTHTKMQVWSELVFGSDVDSLQLNLSEPPPPPSPPAASPTRCQTGLIALSHFFYSAVVINNTKPINYIYMYVTFLCL
jgi:hypothetical protein